MTNVVIYAVRSDRDEHNSLGYQIESCQRAARQRGYRVVGTYDEVNVTGQLMRGPELQRALGDIEAGKAEVLLVTRMDRIVRNFDMQEDLRVWLLARGARWDCVEHDPPPMEYLQTGAKLLAGVRALVNEQAAIDAGITQRNKTESKHRRGIWIGLAPTGYVNIDDGIAVHGGILDPAGKLIGVELYSYAAQYLMLVDWTIKLGSLVRVLDYAASVPWMRPRPRELAGGKMEARRWTRSSLENILRNRAHLGEVRLPIKCYTRQQAEDLIAEDPDNRWLERNYPGRKDRPPLKYWKCVVWAPGEHPALINRETYDQVQDVLTSCSGTRGQGARRNTEVYPLTGHVVDAHTELVTRDSEGTIIKQATPYTSANTQKRRRDGSKYLIRYYTRIDKARSHSGCEVRQVTGPGVHRINSNDLENYIIEERIAPIAERDSGWQQLTDWISNEVTEAEHGIQQVTEQASADRLAHMREIEQLEARVLHGGLARMEVELIERRRDQLRDLVDECETCLRDLEELEAWYSSLPVQVDIARRKYLRAVQYHRAGMRDKLRVILDDIMPEGRGVTIWGKDDFAVELRLGRDLWAQATKFAQINQTYRGWDSNPRPPDPQSGALTN